MCVWAAKIHKLTYFCFLEITRKSSSKSPGEADGQGLREVLEFAATVFLSVGLGLGWGTARHLLSQANAALCFLVFVNSVLCEDGKRCCSRGVRNGPAAQCQLQGLQLGRL